jgi:serpin B
MLSLALALLMPPDANSAFEVSQRRLALDCLAAVSATTRDENICISGYSIQSVMTLLRMGAKGETESEIGRLTFQTQTAAEVAESFSQSHRSLQPAVDRGTLRVANSLWTVSPVKPAFAHTARRLFGAEAQQTTFPEPGLSKVNAWVKEHTAGRIPSIFDQLSRDTEFVIANALWFKDAWIKGFDPQFTVPSTFTLRDGTTIQTPVMVAADVRFRQGGEFVYELDMHNSTLMIGLPEGDLDEALRGPVWEAALSGNLPMTAKTGPVALPKLEFEARFDLLDYLKSRGMKIATSGIADFSNITSAKCAIDQARHRTFFKLDEQGAEAAVATAVSASRSNAPKPGIRARRPFLFAIRVKGTILLMGVVNDPRKS